MNHCISDEDALVVYRVAALLRSSGFSVIYHNCGDDPFDSRLYRENETEFFLTTSPDAEVEISYTVDCTTVSRVLPAIDVVRDPLGVTVAAKTVIEYLTDPLALVK